MKERRRKMLTQEQEARLRKHFREVGYGGLEVEEREQMLEGKKCALAFFCPAQPASFYKGMKIGPSPRKLVGALTVETYQANREQINVIRREEEAQGRERESSWITWALLDRIVVSAGKSWETGLEYYQLAAHLPDEIWRKVASHFEKVEEGGDEEAPVSGWVVVGDATEVRSILRALAEKEATSAHRQAALARLAEEEAEAANQRQVRERRAEQERLLQQIEPAFLGAEKPNPKAEASEEAGKYMPGFEKMTVTGERIDDPLDPMDIHGGGRWFVIQPKRGWIWMIKNNGHDGADWTLNNVATHGAGAIGVRVRYTPELAEKIRALHKEVSNAA
ncbi:MAG: hypothetical protein ACOY58_07765 [Candidatus Micrarchaeota archaeon]